MKKFNIYRYIVCILFIVNIIFTVRCSGVTIGTDYQMGDPYYRGPEVWIAEPTHNFVYLQNNLNEPNETFKKYVTAFAEKIGAVKIRYQEVERLHVKYLVAWVFYEKEVEELEEPKNICSNCHKKRRKK